MVEVAGGTGYSGSKGQSRARRIMAHENTITGIVLAALVAVLGGISRGVTVAPDNIINILLQSSIRGVVAVGQAFVILTANIDLAVSGTGVMVMMVGGTMMTAGEWNHLGFQATPLMAIPAMLAVGACWGLFSGALVSRLNIPALIATFGVWQIGYGVGFLLTNGEALTDLPRSMAIYGALPSAPIIFFSVAAVAYIVLGYTTFGRNIYAVGGNPISSFLSGINVRRTQLAVFAIAGVLSALGGTMMLSRGMAASIEALRGLEMDTIASCTIGGISLFGGQGNIIGVVLGTLIIGVINNAMSVMHTGHAGRYVIKGAIIIGAVAADIIRRRQQA